MSPTLDRLRGLEILDSRGNPTVCVRLQVGKIDVWARVPSGASTGKFEASELRDDDPLRYEGKGVSLAVSSLKEIEATIASYDIEDQRGIDQAMIALDGTNNLNRLGANAILGVSLAVCQAAAQYRGEQLFQYISYLHGTEQPVLLPTPMMNVINGGRHADYDNLRFQEFMIVPGGALTFGEALRMGSEVYQTLKEIIGSKGVGDEGGFVPTYFKSRSAVGRINEMLETVVRAIEKAGYLPGLHGDNAVALALDPAASEFYADGKYQLSDREVFQSAEMVELYQELIREYPIISIEDGVAETDDRGWDLFGRFIGKRIQVVGDDRYVTNSERIRQGIVKGEANSVLIKLNQIGTVSGTLDAIVEVQHAGWRPVISHRSGETEDTTIADLAVATNAGQIKTGAPARTDRTAKYNRLKIIEEMLLPDLGLTPRYAGWSPFPSTKVFK